MSIEEDFMPKKKILEVSFLVTKDGCEVLSRDVPKEIEEIERLLARRK